MKTRLLQIELTDEMANLVGDLKASGLHGKTDAEVVERLLCETLRENAELKLAVKVLLKESVKQSWLLRRATAKG